MSDPYLISRKLPRPEATVTVQRNGSHRAAGSDQKLQCKFGSPGSSARLPSGEIALLLRYRLRLASLIALAAFGIHLLRTLFLPDQSISPTPGTLAFHGVIVAVMIVLACLLWTSILFSLRALRGMELTLFGAMAAFFIYKQLSTVGTGQVLLWASNDPNSQHQVAVMATTLNTMRWFILLVLYGTFIPNSWRRGATIIGIMAAIPLILNFWSTTCCPVMAPLTGTSPLFDSTVLLGLGVAIAIFGSYKISVLEQQAVVARELGQYRLKEKLGSGGMGDVYLGEHVMLRRQCAVKLIRPDQAGDPTNLERFEREVKAMATLTHWNTVEIFDYGHAEDGTFYYVMEYLPGLSLQEIVDKYGPLPPERAIHFLRQICGALQEAHGIGLIHRDIKPSNVIACQRGGVHDVAKLLDFGLVQCFGQDCDVSKLTVQGVILGSPPYMSPEQALGRSNLDSRTDIYSLGALAYFLITGQPPFVRETPMELLVAHAHDKATPPGGADDLQAIVMKCLEKEPARRYATAEELDQALGQCDSADLWSKRAAASWWQDSEARSSAEMGMLVG